MLQQNWMISVQIRARWNAVSIATPQCPGIVRRVQSQTIGMLAQAVKVWIVGHRRPQPQVLRLEHKIRAGRVEERLSIAGARDGEREWVLHHRELEGGGRVARRCAIWTRQYGLRDLVDIIGRIRYLDMNARSFERSAFVLQFAQRRHLPV